MNSDFEIPDSLFSQIGQGCMGIGGEFERDDTQQVEHVRALQYGIELGLNFLDTAEIYSDGYSEELVGRAIKGKREGVSSFTTNVSVDKKAIWKVIASYT